MSIRKHTGETCDSSGRYQFDGYYPNGETYPSPTADERVIPMSWGETFPPVRSSAKAAWWRWIG